MVCQNSAQEDSRRPCEEIQKQRAVIRRGKCASDSGILLAVELDLAARMAEQSCQFMLWQQARRRRQAPEAKALARQGIQELRRLEKDFNAYWPLRNKATPKHCSPFLRGGLRNCWSASFSLPPAAC